MKCFRYLLLIVCLGSSILLANDPRTIYREIYAQISSAENFSTDGELDQAVKNYQEVLFHLENFQKQYPDWEPEIVKFRVQHTRNQIQQLESKLAVQEKLYQQAQAEVAEQSTQQPASAPPFERVPIEPGAKPESVFQQQPVSKPVEAPKPVAVKPVEPVKPVAKPAPKKPVHTAKKEETKRPQPRPTKILPPPSLAKYSSKKEEPKKEESIQKPIEKPAEMKPLAEKSQPAEPKPLTKPKKPMPPPARMPSLPKPPTTASIPEVKQPEQKVTAVSPAAAPSAKPASSATYSAPEKGVRRSSPPKSRYVRKREKYSKYTLKPKSMVLAQPGIKSKKEGLGASAASLQTLALETERKIKELEKDNKALRIALSEAQSRADVSSSYVKVLTRENEFLQDRLNKEIRKLEAIQSLLYTELDEHAARWEEMQRRVRELLGDPQEPYDSPVVRASKDVQVLEGEHLINKFEENSMEEEVPNFTSQ